MKPYYENESGKLFNADCLDLMAGLEENSIDFLCTDPPYGIAFMGKAWDKALVSIEIWKQALRILKPGSFCFVMSSPRQDVLSRMMINLEDAGFNIGFSSIYWTFASGFPKAGNIGKLIDKRAGVEREIIKTKKLKDIRRNVKEDIEKGITHKQGNYIGGGKTMDYNYTAPATSEAKALDGSYGGFQPKPAVEVIIIAMKPLSEKSYVDQALKNRKGVTWLDDCLIPFENEEDQAEVMQGNSEKSNYISNTYFKETDNYAHHKRGAGNKEGRFPANLLVSDDVLNDGKIRKTGDFKEHHVHHVPKTAGIYGKFKENQNKIWNGDSGSYSRYFDLDAWDLEARKVFPFIVTPKPSKAEKNRGLNFNPISNSDFYQSKFPDSKADKNNNNKHPTVKPVKLFKYLIMMTTRAGDVILDPFAGSGTSCIAAQGIQRRFIGVELSRDYCNIARARIEEASKQGIIPGFNE